MQRGLLWLPLLAMFMWLAWSGWNEYQKVEAYRVWAEQFERAKYDIYAVLGQRGTALTWGKPTRKGPVDLATFSLQQAESVSLQVDGEQVDLEALPRWGRAVALRFQFHGSNTFVHVPFTEISLAASWAYYLQKSLGVLQDEKVEELRPE